jgi:bifunctional N-acetylglucosamine-1-phosphate-uridyltransferase/glucosamine-1-phosphate-acetyltransferase GlmU-like protein
MTEIGSECVIGPHCRVIESRIGRGVELKGWNYVTHTSIRNHAVLEPYVRRGYE